mgnify:CR=1 FL=1
MLHGKSYEDLVKEKAERLAKVRFRRERRKAREAAENADTILRILEDRSGRVRGERSEEQKGNGGAFGHGVGKRSGHLCIPPQACGA